MNVLDIKMNEAVDLIRTYYKDYSAVILKQDNPSIMLIELINKGLAPLLPKLKYIIFEELEYLNVDDSSILNVTEEEFESNPLSFCSNNNIDVVFSTFRRDFSKSSTKLNEVNVETEDMMSKDSLDNLVYFNNYSLKDKEGKIIFVNPLSNLTEEEINTYIKEKL